MEEKFHFLAFQLIFNKDEKSVSGKERKTAVCDPERW